MRQSRDPITSFREKIINAELVTADEIKVISVHQLSDGPAHIFHGLLTNLLLCPLQAIEVRIKNEVEDAAKKARTDKEIGLNELTMDIYANPKNCDEIRNILPNQPLTHSTLGRAVNL